MSSSNLRRLAAALAPILLAACASGFDPVSMDPPTSDADHPASMTSIAVESGGSRMNGIVYRAQGPGPHPVVVLLHGYPGDERNLDLAQALRRAGWTVLFFHYRGAWGSEGDFSFAHALEDVAAAVGLASLSAFASEHRADPGRIALVGHSMGGFLALTAGSQLEAVDCIVSLAGANPGIQARGSSDPEAAAATARALDAWSGPIRGTSGAALVSEIGANANRFDTTLRADSLARRKLLLIAGTRDAITPPAVHHAPLVAALEAAGAPDLSTTELAADHAFSQRRVALAGRVVGWLEDACQ